MDQTCDGMHMLSRDGGGSGLNLGPPCNKGAIWNEWLSVDFTMAV